MLYLLSVLFHTTNLKAIDNVCIILTKLGLNFILTNFYLEGEHETGSESYLKMRIVKVRIGEP